MSLNLSSITVIIDGYWYHTIHMQTRKRRSAGLQEEKNMGDEKRRLQIKKPTADKTGVETKIVSVAPGTTPLDLRKNLNIPGELVAFCRGRNPPQLDDGMDLYKELLDNAVVEFVPPSPVAEDATGSLFPFLEYVIKPAKVDMEIAPAIYTIKPEFLEIYKTLFPEMNIVPKGTVTKELEYVRPLSHELAEINWLPTTNGYRGYVDGPNYKLPAMLVRRYGEIYDLLVYDPPLSVLSCPKGPCFMYDRDKWRRMNFGIKNQPALSLIRETEYVLKTWG